MTDRNYSANPSAITAITGWQGGATRITGLTGTPRTTGGRVAMGTGGFSSSLGSDLISGAASGQVWTGVAWIRSSVARTIRADIAAWNSGGFVTGSSGFVDTALAANVWTQVRVVSTLGAGTYNQVNFQLDLPGSGTAGNLDLSSVRVDLGNFPTLVYADGDTASWTWDGTSGSSSSRLVSAPSVPAGRLFLAY